MDFRPSQAHKFEIAPDIDINSQALKEIFSDVYDAPLQLYALVKRLAWSRLLGVFYGISSNTMMNYHLSQQSHLATRSLQLSQLLFPRWTREIVACDAPLSWGEQAIVALCYHRYQDSRIMLVIRVLLIHTPCRRYVVKGFKYAFYLYLQFLRRQRWQL
jgi:hypothetical protein